MDTNAAQSGNKPTPGSRERRTKALNDIRLTDAEGTKRIVKKRKTEGTWVRQFRSNLWATWSFFRNVHLTKAHLNCLKRTPFYHFVLPFAKKQVLPSSVRGAQDGSIQLLLTYDKKRGAFEIAGKTLKIHPNEFDLIFGIKSGTRVKYSKRCSVQQSLLGRRRFQRYTKVSPKILKKELMKIIGSNIEEDIEDTVRIVIVHILSSLLFTISGDVASAWMFKLCDDIDQLKEYNWGKLVVDLLMKYVQDNVAEAVKGCVPLFMFWMCERVNLVEPVCRDAFPRFRKWSLKTLKEKLACTAIKDITDEQVLDTPITETDMERSLLRGNFEEQEVSENEPRDYEDEENDDSEARNELHDSEGESVDADDENDDELDRDAPATTSPIHQSSGSKKRKYVDEHNDDLLTQNTILEARLACALQEAKAWQTKATNVSEHNKELEHRIKTSTDPQLATELDVLQGRLEYELKKSADLSEQIRKLTDANENLHTTIETLVADNEELKAEITTVKLCNNSLVEENKRLNTVSHNDKKSDDIQENARKPENQDMPSWDLLSQTQAATQMQSTIVSTSCLEIVDLSTKCKILEDKQEELLKIIEEQAMQIQSLTNGDCEDQPITLGAQDEDFDLTTSVINYVENAEPTSMVARRTRSKRKDVTPFGKNQLIDVGKNYKKFKPYKDLSEDYKTIVNVMASSEDEMNKVLWRSDDKRACVFVTDIFHCLKKQCISQLVVDSYSKILSLEQCRGTFNQTAHSDLKGRSFVFPSYLLNYVRGRPDGMFDPPDDIINYRYLVFPILHIGTAENRCQDHWTLLVLDKFHGDWIFYNSMRRRSNDCYLAEAMELKRALEKTAAHHNLILVCPQEKIVSLAEAPQQKDDSVDCGVVVLYLIKKLFEQQPIIKDEAESEYPAMRTEIVKTFLDWGNKKMNSSKKSLD